MDLPRHIDTMNIILAVVLLGSLMLLPCGFSDPENHVFGTIPKNLYEPSNRTYEVIVLNPEHAVNLIDPVWEDIMNNVEGLGSNATNPNLEPDLRDHSSSVSFSSGQSNSLFLCSLLVGMIFAF